MKISSALSVFLVCLATFSGLVWPDETHASNFTVPESELLSSEFSTKAYGPATVVRSDAPGDAVDFAFTGLTYSGTGMKDAYPVATVYGQIIPSHGNGDFSNFSGYELRIQNLDSQAVNVSLFINTGFTGPSGNPPNTPANDTFWQSPWTNILPGQIYILVLDFNNAQPWNIQDNPAPHTQGSNGVFTSINAYDRTEVSGIGFQVYSSDNSDATIRVRPVLKVPPGAPTGLAATAAVGEILLDWNDNNEWDLTGYNLYRSTTPGSGYSKQNSSLVTISSYTDSNVSFGTTYYYVVTAVDIDANESNYSGEVSSMPKITINAGAVLREWWTGISGDDVNSLTSDINYPDNPAGRALLLILEGPENWQDNYGTRIRGYLYPPSDGDYTFWIASDANSELWLSSDANSANAVRIAYVSGYTDSREWNKYPEQESTAISLVGAQKYYIEVLHKADIDNDNVAVAWQGPGIAQQVINGFYLSPCCLEFEVFAGFASQWEQNGCNAGNDWCDGFDFSRNGSVELDDLKAFTDGWLDGI
jgi:hypothetical protein